MIEESGNKRKTMAEKRQLFIEMRGIALVAMVPAMGSPTLISNITPNLRYNYFLRMQKSPFASLMTWPYHAATDLEGELRDQLVQFPHFIDEDTEAEKKGCNMATVMAYGAQNFDVIRLSTYRTACKLRFVQKRCNLHLVDIWNMIEAFRDNGLNTLDHTTEISVSRLETVISSIYYQLNKRLPSTHQISVEQSISLLLNFMIAAYDRLVPALLNPF
ncbi:hypothetical protein J1605_018028 [Eschrichtius robustus]|uniref:EF-hand domain-containing protein n=1 Tax=Eschrichtius robustus TaxID=9764 RepID=A0AB34HX60_ESCRO|nr:hypothetical protein J1605_018028 [Eschrichtius robustus]